MAVSIELMLAGHLDRPHRDAAERIVQAVADLVEELTGHRPQAVEHATAMRPFLGDTPEHYDTSRVTLVASFDLSH